MLRTGPAPEFLKLVKLVLTFFSLNFVYRDVDLTERLDYSSDTVLAGYTLVLAVIRSFSIHDQSAKVMVTAPVLALVATHIIYLNFYNLDEGI